MILGHLGLEETDLESDMRESMASATEERPQTILRPGSSFGKTPEPAPDPTLGSPDEKDTPPSVAHKEESKTETSSPWGKDALALTSMAPGTRAIGPERTAPAVGITGTTEKGPEIHERLGVDPPLRGRKKPGGEIPKGRLAPPKATMEISPKALENPPHVGVEHHRRPIVGQGEDRSRSRAAYSGKGHEIVDRPRKTPPVTLDDESSRFVEVMGTAVIAESRPGMEDVVTRRCGQRAERREPPKERGITMEDRPHGGLLEHDLGDPDGIAPPILLPGKIVSPFARIPATESLPEALTAEIVPLPSDRIDRRGPDFGCSPPHEVFPLRGESRSHRRHGCGRIPKIPLRSSPPRRARLATGRIP